MDNLELIKQAASVVESKKVNDFLIGDVGCALETDKGNIYLGICADVASNAFCAEHNAIGSMITGKEYNIKKIVTVWKDDKNNIFVIPPCGNCREFIKQISEDNLDTEVILDKEKSVKLKELLPYFDSWQKIN